MVKQFGLGQCLRWVNELVIDDGQSQWTSMMDNSGGQWRGELWWADLFRHDGGNITPVDINGGHDLWAMEVGNDGGESDGGRVSCAWSSTIELLRLAISDQQTMSRHVTT